MIFVINIWKTNLRIKKKTTKKCFLKWLENGGKIWAGIRGKSGLKIEKK